MWIKNFLLSIIACTLIFATCNKNKKETDVVNNLDSSWVYTPDTMNPYDPIPEETPIYRASKNTDWQLIHTDLQVKFDFVNRQLLGNAVITLKPYFYAQDSLILDAKNMNIQSVKLGLKFIEQTENKNIANANIQWVGSHFQYKDSAQLIIYCEQLIKRNMEVVVAVEYSTNTYNFVPTEGSAITSDRGLYFINHNLEDKNSPRQIWTQGETESNSRWFPTIESGKQKTTQKITITVPDTMTTISNGLLINSKNNADKTRTDIWEQKLPHSPYLVMLAIGNWVEIKDKWRNKNVNYYLEKKYANDAQIIFGNTPKMIEFFSNYTGVDFVWDKYSQVVVRDFVSGAMENTGAVVHYDKVAHTKRQHIDDPMEDIISHELFHHWFGDLVTAENWSEITVNESFANYGEYLWREFYYGRDYADELYKRYLDDYMYSSHAHNKNLVRTNYSSPDDVFDVISYQKGGAILHALREVVGDDAFKLGINMYLKNNQFKSAEATHLRLAMEEASGKDLQWFFNQWYYGYGHPKIKVQFMPVENEQSSDANNFRGVRINLMQFNVDKNFIIPLTIQYGVGKKVIEKQLLINKTSTDFYIDENVDWIIVDATAKQPIELDIEPSQNSEWFSKIISNAIQNTNIGIVKHRLFNTLRKLEFISDGNENKIMKQTTFTSLNSKFKPLQMSGVEVLNENKNWFDEDKTYKQELVRLMSDYSQGYELRNKILNVINQIDSAGNFAINYVNDTSINVSVNAIYELRETNEAKEIGIKHISYVQEEIAGAWLSKLLGWSGVDDKLVVKNYLQNKHISASSFYSDITDLSYLGVGAYYAGIKNIYDVLKNQKNKVFLQQLNKRMQIEKLILDSRSYTDPNFSQDWKIKFYELIDEIDVEANK